MPELNKAGQLRYSADQDLLALLKGLDDQTQITLVRDGDQFIIDPSEIREIRTQGRWLLLSKWLRIAGIPAAFAFYVMLTDQFSEHVPKLQVLIPKTATAATQVYEDIATALSIATPPRLTPYVAPDPLRFVVSESDTFSRPIKEPPGDVLLAGFRYVGLSNVAPNHATEAFLRVSGNANL